MDEVKYHICLDLTPKQVKELKQSALDADSTIKGAIKHALVRLGLIKKEDVYYGS